MKALVTGADGFVAPFLISALHKYDVVGTFKQPITKKLSIPTYYLDIVNEDEVKHLFTKTKPDLVFHLAAISSVKLSFDKPQLTHDVNVIGTKNILKASKDAKVLLIGSSEQYGVPQSIPITENHPLSSKTPYGKSKIEAEMLAKKYDNVSIVRSFNHIGPGQSDDFVVSSFAKQIVEIELGKRDVLHVGNLEARRDFTDVRDVVKAYVDVLEKGTQEIYNVCSNRAFSIKEILYKLITLSKAKIIIQKDPERMRPSDIPVSLGSYEKLHKATGWEPTIPIDKSLKDVLEYWRTTLS